MGQEYWVDDNTTTAASKAQRLYNIIVEFAITDNGKHPHPKICFKVVYTRLYLEIQRLTATGHEICTIIPTEDQETPVSPDQILPWWIEITTQDPPCVYYFGAFDSIGEAHLYERGYLEDLILEQAQGITVYLKQCQPEVLTEEF